MLQWICKGKIQSAGYGWRIFGAENDVTISALSAFLHLPSLGVWLPGLKASFNSAAVWPGKAIWKVSSHSGDAFKINLSSMVTAWATLQPQPCPAVHPIDPDPDSDTEVVLVLTSDLPLLYRLVWWSGLLTEPGACHWTCSGLLVQALWDCPYGSETPDPASHAVTLGSQLAFPYAAVPTFAAPW